MFLQKKEDPFSIYVRIEPAGKKALNQFKKEIIEEDHFVCLSGHWGKIIGLP